MKYYLNRDASHIGRTEIDSWLDDWNTPVDIMPGDEIAVTWPDGSVTKENLLIEEATYEENHDNGYGRWWKTQVFVKKAYFTVTNRGISEKYFLRHLQKDMSYIRIFKKKEMQIVYARQPFPENLKFSIFLAGPTPRDSETKSWRPDAIELFRQAGFSGTLLVPEDPGGCIKSDADYMEQVEWEEEGLKKSSAIMFWIPRDLKNLPGFTTNDEWGTWKGSNKVVLGVPDGAAKCSYQIYYAKKLRIPFSSTLPGAVKLALDKIRVRY